MVMQYIYQPASIDSVTESRQHQHQLLIFLLDFQSSLCLII
jgi:hypothetical protein